MDRRTDQASPSADVHLAGIVARIKIFVLHDRIIFRAALTRAITRSRFLTAELGTFGIFFIFSIIKNYFFCISYQVNLTGSGLFK